jgi:hypothetical protein
MSLKKPEYHVMSNEGKLLDHQLLAVLDALPLHVEVTKGHDLSLETRFEKNPDDIPVLLVEYAAQLISIKPPYGKRLSDACFYGRLGEAFRPSRVMDECTGGGACCSYAFNTGKLGLPFDHEMMIDIYKLG